MNKTVAVIIMIVIGLLMMVIDGEHYGINVGNFGFLITITGILLFAMELKKGL